MEKRLKLKYAVTGAAAGALNGLFGGGGGMALVPLFTLWCGLDKRKAFATSVAAILPMCIFSSAVYVFRCRPDFAGIFPYILGGCAGGIAGGIFFKRIPVDTLRKLFGVLLIVGGVLSIV